jgi:hypothetical protein
MHFLCKTNISKDLFNLYVTLRQGHLWKRIKGDYDMLDLATEEKKQMNLKNKIVSFVNLTLFPLNFFFALMCDSDIIKFTLLHPAWKENPIILHPPFMSYFNVLCTYVRFLMKLNDRLIWTLIVISRNSFSLLEFFFIAFLFVLLCDELVGKGEDENSQIKQEQLEMVSVAFHPSVVLPFISENHS